MCSSDAMEQRGRNRRHPGITRGPCKFLIEIRTSKCNQWCLLSLFLQSSHSARDGQMMRSLSWPVVARLLVRLDERTHNANRKNNLCNAMLINLIHVRPYQESDSSIRVGESFSANAFRGEPEADLWILNNNFWFSKITFLSSLYLRFFYC